MKKLIDIFIKISLSLLLIITLLPINIFAVNTESNDEVKINIDDDYVEIGNRYLTRKISTMDNKVKTESILNGRNGDVFNPLSGSEEFIVRLINEQKDHQAYDRSNWTVEADNEYVQDPARNMIDGDINTIWHSNWANGQVEFPINIIIDMKEAKKISALSYLPRRVGVNGDIKDYEVYVSDDLNNWGEAVKIGAFSYTDDRDEKFINMDKIKTGRYVKFVVCSEAYGKGYGSIAELNFYQDKVEETNEQVIYASDLDLQEVVTENIDDGKKINFTFKPYNYNNNIWNFNMIVTMNSNNHYMRKFIEIKSRKW